MGFFDKLASFASEASSSMMSRYEQEQRKANAAIHSAQCSARDMSNEELKKAYKEADGNAYRQAGIALEAKRRKENGTF